MVIDWQFSAQQEDILIKAGDITAAIRRADDAYWELNDDYPALEPFDPFADESE